MASRIEGKRASLTSSPRRLALAGLGAVCVGLAALGAVLPGLPTTVFLIVASYLFARSCPLLEEKLLRNRLFRPYMRFVDGDAPIPRRARATALILMWAAVSMSLTTLAIRQSLPFWLALVILSAAVAGSVMILGWKRGVRSLSDRST